MSKNHEIIPEIKLTLKNNPNSILFNFVLISFYNFLFFLLVDPIYGIILFIFIFYTNKQRHVQKKEEKRNKLGLTQKENLVHL